MHTCVHLGLSQFSILLKRLMSGTKTILAFLIARENVVRNTNKYATKYVNNVSCILFYFISVSDRAKDFRIDFFPLSSTLTFHYNFFSVTCTIYLQLLRSLSDQLKYYPRSMPVELE